MKGFLPPKSAARRARINELAFVPATLVFFESPRRLAETLADLAAELGDRPAAVARELTKLYETTRRGTLVELAAHFARRRRRRKARSSSSSGRPPPPRRSPRRNSTACLRGALENLSVKDAAAAVSAQTGAPRRQVYARALTLAGAKR